MEIQSIDELKQALRDFSARRDWNQFHTPKNLAMALIVEAAELVEQFQWLSPEESMNPDPERREAVAREMADVLIYLVRLADRLDINLLEAAGQKIVLNAKKYPARVTRSQGDTAARPETAP
ncbi:nucleotide pyrophosphohydrolase [Desulfolithobacter sp.]